jgi:hypothetical protein
LTGDENYCLKYPDDRTFCTDKSLPMMFTVPVLFTYYTGNSILGLGDVILPGFLAVWAARHDARKYSSDFNLVQILLCKSCGLFRLVVVAYCVGLLLANSAVIVFQVNHILSANDVFIINFTCVLDRSASPFIYCALHSWRHFY